MARQAQARHVADAASTDTVTIACKSPVGYRLRLHAESKEREQVLGGGSREFSIFRPTGEELVILGNRVPHGEAPRCRVVGGYAMTDNVPAAFWDEWVRQNEGSQLLTSGIIFAMPRPADADAKAKDGKTLRSGLEPMEPDRVDANGNLVTRDPRMPRTNPDGTPSMPVTVSDAAA